MQQVEFLSTAWGRVRLVWSHQGISSLSLPKPGGEPERAALSEQAREIQRDLSEYLQGMRQTFKWTIDLSALTLFQQRVLYVVQSIPFGEARSYLWVAEQAGCPRGSRAVGQAMGKNPVAIFVP